MLNRRQFFLSSLAASTASAFQTASIRVDRTAIDGLFADLKNDENRDLKGVRILSNGNLAAEAFFNDGGPEKLHDIRSAGKSITSLLVGLAIDKRLIRGVDIPFTQILKAGRSSSLKEVTLEHLLTMRSGLAANDEDPASPGNESRLDGSRAWVDFALSVPAREAPGRNYQYCSLNAFLAGACVEDACGQPLDEFAAQHLFAPLGISRFEWRRGPENRGAGQGNLRITLSAMASIGQMCLMGGRAGSRQIVSKRWVERSVASLVPIAHADPYADAYGYMWYTKTHDSGAGPVRVHFASGNGGNKIYILPELRMVVAIASAAYGRGYGQRRSQEILKRILSAVRV